MWDKNKSSNLARARKKKEENDINIADKKINQKSFNLVETEEEN